VEELDLEMPRNTKEEQFVSRMVDKVSYQDGRFRIQLPFKVQMERVPDSKLMSERRGALLEKRLKKDDDLKQSYDRIIVDYLEKGYITELTEERMKNVKWWLPHFPVIKRNKETTKIRIVFDAAAKSKNICLNDLIEPGPKLQNDLLEILLGFQKFPIALVSDIQEMYIQIAVSEMDQEYLCFHHKMNGETRNFQFQRLVFGLNASPFLAQLVARVNADQFSKEFPEAVEIIKNATYMDDTMFSVADIEEAKIRKEEIVKIWNFAGMKATKWISNDSEIVKTIPVEDRSRCLDLVDKDVCFVKTLGVSWDPITDSFSFKADLMEQSRYTKRSFLSFLARIFDPLGLVGAYTIKGKILLQEVWMTGLDWDQELPQSLQEKIRVWLREASELNQIHCKRKLFSLNESGKEVHIFSDASMDAYAAVGFAVERTEFGVTTNFIMAKTKVSPMKPVSIPRLELLGACLGVKVAQKISKAIKVDISKFIFWSDSQDVLYWITQHGKQYKPFVANRIGFIQQITNARQWRFVPTALNPADILSRGIKTENYSKLNSWYQGPEFLKKEESLWPKWEKRTSKEKTVSEKRSQCSFLKQITEKESFWKTNCFEPETYSNWNKLI